MNDKELLSEQGSKELLSSSKELLPIRKKESHQEGSDQQTVGTSHQTTNPSFSTNTYHQTSVSFSRPKPQYMHTVSGDIPYDEWHMRRSLEKYITEINQKRKEASKWRIDEWRRKVSLPAGNSGTSLELFRVKKY